MASTPSSPPKYLSNTNDPPAIAANNKPSLPLPPTPFVASPANKAMPLINFPGISIAATDPNKPTPDNQLLLNSSLLKPDSVNPFIAFNPLVVPVVTNFNTLSNDGRNPKNGSTCLANPSMLSFKFEPISFNSFLFSSVARALSAANGSINLFPKSIPNPPP